MEQEEYNLEQEYEILKEKHNLPSFEALAADFDIEKLLDKETLFLVREIRRTINEKIQAYIHLIETLINPQGPPMFVFKILKNITAKEKEALQQIYKDLSKTQLQVMKLDTIYSEPEEIKFIKENFKSWQETKQKIHKLFASFEENFETDDLAKNTSYFD